MSVTLEQLYNEFPKERKNHEIAIQHVQSILMKLNVNGRQLAEAKKTFAIDRTSKTVSFQVISSLVHRIKRENDVDTKLKSVLNNHSSVTDEGVMPDTVLRELITKCSFQLSDEEVDEMINDCRTEDQSGLVSIDTFVDLLLQ